ncbi:MAG: hypothetical protein LBS91_10335 [Clostridiales Family XIII bacterium]|nr:hypothetical protein [Clostridiales Family XIII bacterium]
MKKITHIISMITVSVLALLLGAGCGGDSGGGSAGGGGEAAGNSKIAISVVTQEYSGDNIVEILTLENSGGENPEVDSLNSAVGSGIGQRYADFEKNHADGEWIEIKSYPFTSEDYLQIVTTCSTYPSYGTDGDLYSYNFDKRQNKFLALQEVMDGLGLDNAALTANVKKLYEPEAPSMSASAATAAGFLLQPGADGPVTLLLLKVDIENTESEPWSSFFVYVPAYDSLSKLDAKYMFEPGDLDVMDPPLSYAR